MKNFEYVIKDSVGIHARPAGMLVKEAKKYESRIVIGANGKSAEATKLMAVMGLGIKQGETVTVTVEGGNEEANTARRYLDVCELEVLEPRYSDDFVLKLLYEIINKRTGLRVKLPEGVFDMTTAVHGIFE